MKTYIELLSHPESAVSFGPKGFQLTDEAWQAIAGQAYLNCIQENPSAFEPRYEAVEQHLYNELVKRIKTYSHSPALRQKG